MKQHAFEFDTSVAAEGFRQIQTANEYSLCQRDAWVERFLENARNAFGLSERKTKASNLAQELEQRGYFGFSHYLEFLAENECLHLTRKASPCVDCRFLNRFGAEDQALAGIFSPQPFIF